MINAGHSCVRRSSQWFSKSQNSPIRWLLLLSPTLQMKRGGTEVLSNLSKVPQVESDVFKPEYSGSEAHRINHCVNLPLPPFYQHLLTWTSQLSIQIGTEVQRGLTIAHCPRAVPPHYDKLKCHWKLTARGTEWRGGCNWETVVLEMRNSHQWWIERKGPLRGTQGSRKWQPWTITKMRVKGEEG